jgi:lipopolysaccharide transport system permease protein
MRDVKLRYAQTLLGVGWVVIQPVAAMAAFSLFLGNLAGLSGDGIPYPVFVLGGLTVWFVVAGGSAAAAESLADHRELVEKVYFPRVIAPVAAVGAGAVDLVISLVTLAVAMAVAGVAPGPEVLLAPVWLAGAFAAALGAGLWLSALNVLYRDFRYALPYLLQIWLFVSPVVFASSIVPDDSRWAYALNPLVGVIDGFRWSVLDGPPPPPADLVSALTLALLLGGGAVFFQSVERRMADRI